MISSVTSERSQNSGESRTGMRVSPTEPVPKSRESTRLSPTQKSRAIVKVVQISPDRVIGDSDRLLNVMRSLFRARPACARGTSFRVLRLWPRKLTAGLEHGMSRRSIEYLALPPLQHYTKGVQQRLRNGIIGEKSPSIGVPALVIQSARL